MKMVKINPQPAVYRLPGFVEDFFHTGLSRWLDEDFFKGPSFETHPPVNIHETNESYRLDVVAPGFEKSDFRIKVEGDVLFLSVEKKEEKVAEGEKQLRREFSFRSFKRSFNLQEAVDASRIQARYEQGILQIVLPKKEDKIEPAKDIAVE